MIRYERGYIRLSGKRAMQRFKDVPSEELLTLEEASAYDSYAAVLADDVVCVDFDDKDSASRMLDITRSMELGCLVFSTDRGAHFIFRNKGSITSSRTGATLAIGLKADIKAGCRNSYIVRRKEGVDRPCIYECAELEELPSFLRPVRSCPDFAGMEEGDGRNNALFSYILTLQSNEFTEPEVRLTLSVINRFIFSKPLSDKELETIWRDAAFHKPVFFGAKGEFFFDRFARYMVDRHHILRINGRLHIYDEGAYVPSDQRIMYEMIQEISRLGRDRRNEVLSYIEVLLAKRDTQSDARYITFKNGVYDVETRQMLPFSPDIIVTNPIPHDYLRECYSKEGDKVLDNLANHDRGIRLLIEEVMGACFYRRAELRKSFLMVGDKANGKSTFVDILKTMLGSWNISGLDLKELADRFKTAELVGKLANLGDDIDDKFISDVSTFKKLVSGDMLNAERKGKDPFDFSNYGKLIFSANSIPRIQDRTGAVMDRLIIIPFSNRFVPGQPDYDPYIKHKLHDEEICRYFVRVAVEGLHRMLDNEGFTICDAVQQEMRTYEIENNSVMGWYEGDERTVLNTPTPTVYNEYSVWCEMNGCKPLSAVEFGKQMRRCYGWETRVTKSGRRSVRVYTR